jgi:branched-chain amino acid transport system permease protein
MAKKRFVLPTWAAYLINAVLFAAFILVGNGILSSGVLPGFITKVAMLIGIQVIASVSLNVSTGYLGQLPLGHAGFMAVGAYASAIFMTRTGIPSNLAFPIGILIGTVVAGLFGVLIGIPALRLKGDYLAIITLGFGEIIRIVLLNIDSVLGFKLTNGAAGLQGIPKTTTFINTWLMVGITCFLIHTFMKSRHGRAVLSIRENEIAAESCGVKTTYYKTLAFAISAAFAGTAGALYAGYLGILNPSNFGFMKSIEILVMVVLGGMGSMAGSILAAIVLTAAPEALRAFDNYRMIVYSLLLIITMIFKPSGLLGRYDFSMKRVIEKCVNGELFSGLKRRGKGAEKA